MLSSVMVMTQRLLVMTQHIPMMTHLPHVAPWRHRLEDLHPALAIIPRPQKLGVLNLHHSISSLRQRPTCRESSMAGGWARSVPSIPAAGVSYFRSGFAPADGRLLPPTCLCCFWGGSLCTQHTSNLSRHTTTHLCLPSYCSSAPPHTALPSIDSPARTTCALLTCADVGRLPRAQRAGRHACKGLKDHLVFARPIAGHYCIPILWQAGSARVVRTDRCSACMWVLWPACAFGLGQSQPLHHCPRQGFGGTNSAQSP